MPEFINKKTVMYFSFALDEADEKRAMQSALLDQTVDQIKLLVDGKPDICNNATFKLTINEIVVDEALLYALYALSV